MRKKNFLAITLALLLAILMGCLELNVGDEPIINQDQGHWKNFPLKGSVRGSDYAWAHYGVIELDSIEYIVVVSNTGVAVCPKVYK